MKLSQPLHENCSKATGQYSTGWDKTSLTLPATGCRNETVWIKSCECQQLHGVCHESSSFFFLIDPESLAGSPSPLLQRLKSVAFDVTAPDRLVLSVRGVAGGATPRLRWRGRVSWYSAV